MLRAEGRTGKEIAEITGYNPWYISKLAAKYHAGGLEAIVGNHYGGNHRNMSFEEETALLEQFVDDADGGRLTDVSAIKAAYDEKIGHKTGHGQIYYVLHRHGWGKKLPRSKHPKSADHEAGEPLTGESCFLVMPYCNTVCMNIFLEHLSASYPDDYIVLVCDGAAWHKSRSLKTFPNIELMFIPPYTPEMNPIEQIWKELRARGFHNEVFQTLEKVVDRLCDTICNLSADTICSIIGREWISGCFD